MKNTLKTLMLALTAIITTSTYAGLGDTIADFIVSKAPNPAVKASCSFYAASSAVAKGYNLAPGVKNTMKQVCCKDPKFRESNKNTVSGALDNCEGVEAEEGYRASDEDFCSIAALAGGSLSKSPTRVKTVLKNTCCDYENVMGANPKAAKAIGCSVE